MTEEPSLPDALNDTERFVAERFVGQPLEVVAPLTGGEDGFVRPLLLETRRAIFEFVQDRNHRLLPDRARRRLAAYRDSGGALQGCGPAAPTALTTHTTPWTSTPASTSSKTRTDRRDPSASGHPPRCCPDRQPGGGSGLGRLLLDAGAPLDVFDRVQESSPLGWAAHGSR